MKTSSIDLAIIELLHGKHCHLKASEVHEKLQPRFPALNASTVYRALERLVSNGKISVSDMGTGAAVYEKVDDGIHHHLVCQKCGRVKTIEHEQVSEFFAQIDNEFGFKVVTNHLILFGDCSECSSSSG